MLCHHCRVLATRIIQRASPKVSQHSRLLSSISTQTQRATRVLPRVSHSSPRASHIRSRPFSASATASDSAAAASSATPALPEKPDYLDDAESAIWDKLTAEFSPTELMVQDISGGCGSMYGIEITSEKFRGVNMLKQQRMVNAALGDQMKDWHGVQLRTKVP
ncbi:bola-like protein [Hypoxylon rubiginosum]|uniref:Bola-like protein n=1 Tax=Hypoxylon rubiginosum TaxID=110542 RepID=A0ACC0D404_9PEZI|nr:bola-like protein [Hypoxylon rubiginosum]